ncbi:MAG: acyltransferase [Oscillochloris sp.]|nr:acyltransferase [Oscillochloris sp.]
MNKRLRWLDATRGLAALIVLASHTVDYFWRGYADAVQAGNAGVVLFFLCSGYVIPISLEALSLKRFWLRRFFRLYPLYWLSIVLFLALGSHQVALPVIAANLTMLQFFMGIPHISSIYWSLTVEMVFYIMVSALKLLRLHHWTFEVLIVLCLGLTVLRHVAPTLANLLVYLPVCLFGTLIYWVDQQRYGRRELLSGLALLVVYLCSWPAPLSFIVGWLLVLGLFLTIYSRRDLFQPALLIWCGQVSYSIYLLHAFPLWLTRGWGMPLVFLVAAIGYAVIERPAIRLGHWLTRRPRGAAVGEHATLPS